MAKCEQCRRFAGCFWKTDPEIICSRFDPKPMTNGDRIRAMSDEELVKFLQRMTGCDKCYVWGKEKMYEASWLEWLKEYSDETDHQNN